VTAAVAEMATAADLEVTTAAELEVATAGTLPAQVPQLSSNVFSFNTSELNWVESLGVTQDSTLTKECIAEHQVAILQKQLADSFRTIAANEVVLKALNEDVALLISQQEDQLDKLLENKRTRTTPLKTTKRTRTTPLKTTLTDDGVNITQTRKACQQAITFLVEEKELDFTFIDSEDADDKIPCLKRNKPGRPCLFLAEHFERKDNKKWYWKGEHFWSCKRKLSLS
jgi:hypothetical protein